MSLGVSSSLSDLKNRSENSAGRGQILTILQVNSHSIDQKIGEICTGQADLQPIYFKSDRLLAPGNYRPMNGQNIFYIQLELNANTSIRTISTIQFLSNTHRHFVIRYG